MKKVTAVVLLLLMAFGILILAEENKVPFSSIKSSCYGEIDMSKAEFKLSEVGRECVTEEWLEKNQPEKESSDLEEEGEITLEEIVVKRGERRTIEGKEILLKGNLYVHPNARLHLKNTHLKVSQRHKAQRWIVVEEKSDLIIEDSIIEQVDFVTDRPKLKDFMHTNLVIRGHGASTINVIDSEVHARLHRTREGKHLDITPKTKIRNSKVGFLRWGTRAEMDIQNSDIGTLIIVPSSGTVKEKMVIEGIRRRRQINGFSLESKDGGYLKIDGTLIHGGLDADFHVQWEHGVTHKRIKFVDCDLFMIQTNIPEAEERIRIHDLPKTGRKDRSGHIDKFDLSEHVEGISLPYNYIVEDSNFLGVKLELWDTNLLVEDSRVMLHPHTGEVEAVVRNTEMTNHINYNSEKMVFENVLFTAQLKFLTQPHPEKELGFFDHTFKNCKANLQNMVVATNEGKLSGEIDFTNLTLSSVAWEKGEITREYPVIVKDENDKPVSNVELELYDKNDQLIWSGNTNEEGKAYFEINFDKSNYEGKWKLRLGSEDEPRAEIGFLSDTPVEIVE